ncbi:hypothetical protein CEQ07_03885 [Oligella urethralis]|uniref:hypothetical protein n=1 Tax=Oligella urethralis TaxID=90245 RepID=UPI000CFEC011|nr:hypothetical protein [Oligella urethralis]AVL70644.1 hypothetical protein CEQ07_03885 [Oligella urethralis]
MLDNNLHNDSLLIDMLGGTAVVSRIFNVKMPTVSYWRKNGIPEARMMYLEVQYKSIVKKYLEELSDDKYKQQ